MSANADSSQIADLEAIAESLETANKGMMSWMNNWAKNSSGYIDQDAKPAKGIDESKVIEFLEAEREKIAQVKEDINKSIEAAKKALAN